MSEEIFSAKQVQEGFDELSRVINLRLLSIEKRVIELEGLLASKITFLNKNGDKLL